MYATIKFEGYLDEILEHAVKKGLAKTKVEALRMGILELDRRYNLLSKEDDLAVKKMQKLSRDIKSGKRKVMSEKEAFERNL